MYQCENCGGNYLFDIKSQLLKCEHCDTVRSPYSFHKEKDAEEINISAEEAGINVEKPEDSYEVTIYTCPQCGAELISDDTTVATFCSFCGGSTILDKRISRERRPKHIIPFIKTKEECQELMADHIRKNIFAPDYLKTETQGEKIRGIYMPYWVYSFKKDGKIMFTAKRYSRRGDYDITKYYNVYTNIDQKYEDIPFDASSTFDDNISQAVAPYNMKKAQNFAPAFISGFYADTSDVGKRVYQNEASDITTNDSILRVTNNKKLRSYTLSPGELKTVLKPDYIKVELALLPVWFMSFRKGDRVLYSVINGQTGKVYMDMPIATSKYLVASAILAVPLFILFNLLFTFKPMTMLFIAIICAIIAAITSSVQSNRVYAKENHLTDKGYLIKIEEEKPKSQMSVKAKSIWKPIAGILLAAMIAVFSPVQDYFYYIAAMVCMAMNVWSFADIIKQHNILSTHKLPQLGKRGGDENVEI